MAVAVKTINLAAFRWNESKQILHHKRAMLWGEFPNTILVKGKYNKVIFRHVRNDAAKRHAYYEYAAVDGPENPHINTNVKLIIPWKERK